VHQSIPPCQSDVPDAVCVRRALGRLPQA
jgi:hypothetical protein